MEYLAKLDLDGNRQWLRESTDRKGSVVADGLGNVFQATGRSLSNHDGNGVELWRRETGALASGLSADGAGNIYVTSTVGHPAPSDDGLLQKFDSAGNHLWTRQFGTSDHEQSIVVTADAVGNVFTYGTVWGSTCNTCRPSATLTKFDSEGNEYWTAHFSIRQVC